LPLPPETYINNSKPGHYSEEQQVFQDAYVSIRNVDNAYPLIIPAIQHKKVSGSFRRRRHKSAEYIRNQTGSEPVNAVIKKEK